MLKLSLFHILKLKLIEIAEIKFLTCYKKIKTKSIYYKKYNLKIKLILKLYKK